MFSEPDIPSNLSVFIKTGKIVELSWKPPLSGEYSGFKLIILSEEDEQSARSYDFKKDVLSFTIRDLTPGASYEIQLYTVHGENESTDFQSSNFTTSKYYLLLLANERKAVLYQSRYLQEI